MARLDDVQPQSKKLKTNGTLASALLSNGQPRPLKAKVHDLAISRPSESLATISHPLGHGNLPTPLTNESELIVISSDEEDDPMNTDSKVDNTESPPPLPQDKDLQLNDAKSPPPPQTNQLATFGDIVAQDPSNPILVDNFLPALVAQPFAAQSSALVPPSNTTLATVLAQALRTNDSQLLESCLVLNDLSAVRNTISKLPCTLAESLLNALATRLHARPGRANNLMVWLQWTLVAHGGYLAGKKDVIAKLGSLQRVVRERAMGLAPLLELKGKLDMLSAQMEFRRLARAPADYDDDDDDAVIYVEDEENEINNEKLDEEEEVEDEGPTITGGDEVFHSSHDGEEEDSQDDSESEASSNGMSDVLPDEDSDSDVDDDHQPSTKKRSKSSKAASR